MPEHTDKEAFKVGRKSMIAERADNPEEMENLWNCMVEFQRVTKAMESKHAESALKAAAFVNHIRSAVDTKYEDA